MFLETDFERGKNSFKSNFNCRNCMANIRVPHNRIFNNFQVHVIWFYPMLNWVRNSLRYSVPREHFQHMGWFLHYVFQGSYQNLFLEKFLKVAWYETWKGGVEVEVGESQTAKQCCPSIRLYLNWAYILWGASESIQISSYNWVAVIL